MDGKQVLNEVLDHIPQGVFWKDTSCVYLGCNRMFAEIAGLESPEDIVGKTDFDLPWTKEQTEHYRNYDRQVMESGKEILNLVESLTASDGTLRWHQVDKIPLKDKEGKVWGVLGTYQDITQRKLNEEAMVQSLKEKETLLKEIHHRIKNNLQIVSSLLNLQSYRIKDSASQFAVQDSIERIRSIALVHEKLYNSASLSSINFPEYLQELLSGLVRTMGEKISGISYRIDAEPIILDIDTAVPLGLMVNECVSNCFKHAYPDSRVGTIDIIIRTENEDAVFLIRDDGVGIPEERIEQRDTLGLQLLETLADQLEGSVELHSGKGTEVRIQIPLSRIENTV